MVPLRGALQRGHGLLRRIEDVLDGLLVRLHTVQRLRLGLGADGVRVERGQQRIHSRERVTEVLRGKQLQLLVDPRSQTLQDGQLLEPFLAEQQLRVVLIACCLHLRQSCLNGL